VILNGRLHVLDTFAILREETSSFVMSVRLSLCPQVITRLSLDGYS
jgi:hypothetical protein